MSNIQPETIWGGEFTDEDSQRLHEEMNKATVVPRINGRLMTFPAYEYRPYPAAIYGVWTDSRKRDELIQVARLNSLNLLLPLERERAESLLPPWDSRLVQNDRELKDWLSKGWTEHPDQVKEAHQKYLDAIADQAAMRAYDDQRMSEKAKAEFDAADRANGAEHLVDLPVPVLNKKRGRPRKTEDTATSVA